MNGTNLREQNAISGPDRPAPETALMVSQRLSALVTALNLLRLSLNMYPPGHVRIQEATEQAGDLLQKSLQGRMELNFIIDGPMMASGEIPLDPNNSSVRDYLRTLSSFRLVSISFVAGVSKQEIVDFHKFLAQKPSDVWMKSTVARAVAQAGITRIRVKSLDADDFQITDEREIFFTPENKENKKGDFWLDFLARSKELSLTIADPALSPFLDPSFQARALNERPDLWQGAVDSYEKLVREYFLDLRHGNAGSAIRFEALANISNMLKSLTPELRAQLLDSLERQVCLQPETVLELENLKCFPKDVFQQIIQLNQERKNRISPTLILLMQKMTTVHRQEMAATGVAPEEDFSVGSVRDLIKRENYEKYVPVEYENLLRDAAETPGMAVSGEEAFPLQWHLQSLQDDEIQYRITYFSLVMMEEDIPDEEYRLLSEHLVTSAMGLVSTGRFSLLTEVLETLQTHTRTKPSESVRQRALWTIKAFTSRQMMSLVEPFLQIDIGQSDSLKAYLKTCGEDTLPWLFDLYLDRSFAPSPFFLGILNSYGKAAGDEAYRRLKGQDSLGISRLLTFIRDTAQYNVSTALKELYQQGSWDVRMEVLETLLQFKDPLAPDLLRDGIRRESWEEKTGVISLISRHRIWGLIGDVLVLVKTFLIREEDAVRNEWIIREIAASRDPAIIPHMESLAKIRWTLSPRRLSRMKRLIRETLPPAA